MFVYLSASLLSLKVVFHRYECFQAHIRTTYRFWRPRQKCLGCNLKALPMFYHGSVCMYESACVCWKGCTIVTLSNEVSVKYLEEYIETQARLCSKKTCNLIGRWLRLSSAWVQYQGDYKRVTLIGGYQKPFLMEKPAQDLPQAKFSNIHLLTFREQGNRVSWLMNPHFVRFEFKMPEVFWGKKSAEWFSAWLRATSEIQRNLWGMCLAYCCPWKPIRVDQERWLLLSNSDFCDGSKWNVCCPSYGQ